MRRGGVRSGARVTAVAAVGAMLALGVNPAAGADRERRALGRIAYASDADGDYELFVMRADGTGRRQLTHNEVDDFAPSWSPDGRRLVFERERTPGGYEDLYLLDVASGRVRPWIRSAGVDEGDAEWSPDGRWIAFRGNDGGDGSDVIVLRLDKKRGRIVSSQSENSTNSDPTWSPDGRTLGLVESYDESGIYTASVCCSGGYEKEEVTYGYHFKSALDWSPDGSCFLYSEETYSEEAGGGMDVYTIPVDGGRPWMVMDGAQWATAGSWSPDGSQVLLYSDARGSYDLYVADPDGSDVRRLTKTPKVDEITPEWWAPPVKDPVTPECGNSTPPPTPQPTPSPLPTLPPR